MKFSRWMVAVALVAAAAAPACTDAPRDDAAMAAADRPAGAETATQTAALDTSVVFVDVRTEREYASGHVEGAINIPHDQMAERYEELAPYQDRQIVVYCRSGRRSSIAEGILEDHGFDNVVNGGGLRELASEGVPTTANCC